jgi:hypothetical protein
MQRTETFLKILRIDSINWKEKKIHIYLGQPSVVFPYLSVSSEES